MYCSTSNGYGLILDSLDGRHLVEYPDRSRHWVPYEDVLVLREGDLVFTDKWHTITENGPELISESGKIDVRQVVKVDFHYTDFELEVRGMPDLLKIRKAIWMKARI